MKLISFDKETITIRMNRTTELSPLLAVLFAVSNDYASLDPELLTTLSEDKVDRLNEEIRRVRSEADQT